MLDQKGFDAWAGDYEQSIERNSQGYPFEGYYEVLSYVHSLVETSKPVKILDVGIGTGLLTYELDKKGAEIYGIDFSAKMIELAKKKITNGKFYSCNFKYGLPDVLKGIKFDYIISSYAIHHITDEEKVKLIEELKNNLKEQGKIIIADVAFATRDQMEECKKKSKNKWDADEFYMVAEDTKSQTSKLGLDVKYNQISSCAGVFELRCVMRCWGSDRD